MKNLPFYGYHVIKGKGDLYKKILSKSYAEISVIYELHWLSGILQLLKEEKGKYGPREVLTSL
jgi:hypothetical protein